eukprot:355924-Chlamydomonas_euryale.AAC.6
MGRLAGRQAKTREGASAAEAGRRAAVGTLPRTSFRPARVDRRHVSLHGLARTAVIAVPSAV